MRRVQLPVYGLCTDDKAQDNYAEAVERVTCWPDLL